MKFYILIVYSFILASCNLNAKNENTTSPCFYKWNIPQATKFKVNDIALYQADGAVPINNQSGMAYQLLGKFSKKKNSFELDTINTAAKQIAMLTLHMKFQSGENISLPWQVSFVASAYGTTLLI